MNAIICPPDEPSPTPTPIPVWQQIRDWKSKISAANVTKSATLDVNGVLNLLEGIATITESQQNDN